MFGRLIVALLIIGAAAVVTMERETAEVADMTATLAESKYSDAEERAQLFEKRARAAEARLVELEAKNGWLEGALAEVTRDKELALLPLELRTKNPAVRGGLELPQVMKVVRENAMAMTPCFARAPSRGPEITMQWVVSDGRVVSVLNGGVPDGFETVIECLGAEIATWTFPKDDVTFAQISWVTRSPVEP